MMPQKRSKNHYDVFTFKSEQVTTNMTGPRKISECFASKQNTKADATVF